MPKTETFTHHAVSEGSAPPILCFWLGHSNVEEDISLGTGRCCVSLAAARIVWGHCQGLLLTGWRQFGSLAQSSPPLRQFLLCSMGVGCGCHGLRVRSILVGEPCSGSNPRHSWVVAGSYATHHTKYDISMIHTAWVISFLIYQTIYLWLTKICITSIKNRQSPPSPTLK